MQQYNQPQYHHMSQYPTNTPQYPTNTPQYPTNTPQYPTNTPQYPTNTPQYPTNTPQYPTNTPQYPTNTPQYPTNTPQYPTNTPQYPTNTPQYPTNTPQYPTNTPQYPTNTPQYPTNTPQYPTNTPQYPTNTPQYPTNTPQYPTNTPQYPTNTPQYPNNFPPQQPNTNIGPYQLLSPMQSQVLQPPQNLPAISQLPPSLGQTMPPQSMSRQGPIIPDGVNPLDPRLLQTSCSYFPRLQQLRQDFKIPFGITIQPLAQIDTPIEAVNFGACDVIRCSNCRAYINPYVLFLDRGAFWQCNICGKHNPVPNEYSCPLDANTGRRLDWMDRPELRDSVYEIIAPGEYMRRPPQPPCYVFVIDVTAPAIKSGLVAVVAESILNVLEQLPGDDRTQVGFITFNGSVHFYQFKNGWKMPHMLAVPSVLHLFLPAFHEELLVHVKEHLSSITSFLTSLPLLFNNSDTEDVSFGPAIEAAVLLLEPIGGKLIPFISSIPSNGTGALKNREDPRIFGTDTEHTALNMAIDFYKSLSIKCCLNFITIDLFACGEHFLDLATLSSLCRWSAGQLYHFPCFRSSVDGMKLKADITRNLLREQGFEGVIRLRGTQGLKFQQIIGNFFMRGQDLLSLPCLNVDQVFTCSILHDDKILNADRIAIQCAILYSTSYGERRIRVLNHVIPCTDSIADLFSSCNSVMTPLLIAKQTVDVAIRSGFHSARDFLRTSCIDIIKAYKKTVGGRVSFASELDYPSTLQSIPLMMLGVIKCKAFRAGNDVRTDDRVAALALITTISSASFESYIRPRLIPIHDLRDLEGLPYPDSPNYTVLPAELPLSASSLSSDGAYLLDNGSAMYLRLGRYLTEPFFRSVFNIRSLQGVDASQLKLQVPSDNSPTPLRRITNIINYLRTLSTSFQTLYIFIEGDSFESRFSSYLIEDKLNNVLSYSDFLRHVDVNSSN